MKYEKIVDGKTRTITGYFEYSKNKDGSETCNPKKNWKIRSNTLLNTIIQYINTPPVENLTTVKLYY